MTKRAVILLTTTLLIVAAAAVATRATPVTGARAAALAAMRRAQQARVTGQRGAEFDALLHALDVDPTYAPAAFELVRHPRVMLRWHDAWPSIERVLQRMPDRPAATCIRSLFLLVRLIDEPLSQSTALAAPECANLRAVYATGMAKPDQIARAIELARSTPESFALAEFLLSPIATEKTALQVASEMIDQPAVLMRAAGYALRAQALAVQGLDSASMTARLDGDRHLRGASLNTRMTFLSITNRLHEVDTAIVRWGDRDNQILWLTALGTRAYGDGQLDLSYALWQDLIDRYCDSVDVCGLALTFRGRTHLKAGKLDLAERDLRAAARLAARSDDQGVRMEIEHNLFHIFEARNRVDSAVAAGHRFIKETESRFRDPSRMMAHHDVGWYLWRVGRYEDARVMLTRMLSIIDTIDNYQHWRAEYYERIGDLGRALEAYPRTLKDGRPDFRSIARRAALAVQLGDTAAAFAYARQHDATNTPGYPEWAPILPGMLAQFGQPQQAWAAFEQAEATALKHHRSAARANLKLGRAALAIEMGKPGAARAAADSAIPLAAQAGMFDVELLARQTHALADVLIDPAASPTRLADIVRRASKLNMPQLTARLHVLHGDALAARARVHEALASYARAAALNDSVARTLPSDADQAMFRAFAAATSNKALQLIVRLASDKENVALYVPWSMQRKARGLQGSESVPLPAHGDAVIDYAVLDSTVVALLITRDTTLLRVLPISAAALNRAATQLRNGVAPRIGNRIDVQRSHFDTETATRLHAALIQPFMPQLEHVNSLVIIPDGVLHHVPFDALTTTRDGTPKYLVSRFAVRISPSLGMVGAARTRAQGRVLVIAGEVSAVEDEIKALQSSVPAARLRVRQGAAAAERSTVNAAAGVSILHFAAHAVTNDAQPLFAYLQLQPDATNDGRLHAFEVSRMQLNNALIVLSACDTGAGRIAGSEGVLSLSRAFLRGGASGTIATLWPVGPPTAHFMQAFYAALGRGMNEASALREAKLHMLQTRYADPLYWAPFVLVTAR